MASPKRQRVVGSLLGGVMLWASLPSAAAAECVERTAIYASVEAVVTRFSRCFHTTSRADDREFIGAVLATGTGYVGVAEPGRRGHDRIHLRIVKRPGERLVALWHTHGAPGYARELFSPTDTDLANGVGVPFYLTTPAGEIRVFDPQQVVRVMRDDARRVLPLGVAAGEAVRPVLPQGPADDAPLDPAATIASRGNGQPAG